MPTAARVILFDAAGTLIHLTETVGAHYRRVALAFGITPDAAALDRAFLEAWKNAPPRLATDGPRPDDDKGWWRDLVDRVFGNVLTPEEHRRFDLPAYFEAVYAHFAKPGVWLAFPDTAGALQTLRERGHRLGVVSNFDRRLHRVLADLGLAQFFEHIVISSEVGADKPDPRIFRRALELFGVSADGAWHVGDDPHKDWGAGAFGLQVFELERPRHTLRDILPILESATGA